MGIFHRFFSFLPIIKFQVLGNSMFPLYKAGDMVLVNKFAYFLNNPKRGDIVILTDPRDKRVVLKRIAKIANKKYYVLGDNEKESTDSRTFGWIRKEQVVGKVIFHSKQ